MAGRVDLPPLQPTTTSSSSWMTRCLALTPAPAAYAPRVELDAKKQQPGRASVSQSWIRDKTLRHDVALNSLGRGRGEMSRENWKRPASRAPSVHRCDKKPRRPAEMVAESEASLLAGVAPSVDRSEKKPVAKMEVDSEASFFAGPTFIVSPDPSELSMQTFLYKHKLARTAARCSLISKTEVVSGMQLAGLCSNPMDACKNRSLECFRCVANPPFLASSVDYEPPFIGHILPWHAGVPLLAPASLLRGGTGGLRSCVG
ncbi:hypothetical protein ZWY2020_058743 [Hordeum vulgare]|nr:hypothetical protein ZWY2020_058743 [Hordeum vulgare]